MEAGEAGLRQSGIPSASSSSTSTEHSRKRPHDLIETSSYRERPSMATTLISPSAPYHHHHAHSHSHSHHQHQHQHHNSFSSGYPHSAPATSIPGMISPVEPRRLSDDSESSHAHRQSLPSLPSISEVFAEKKVLGTYAPPPSSAPIPPPQSLPSPFSSAPPPRPFADVSSPDKNPSPRTLHPTSSSSSFPRPDSLPAFSDAALPALASRPVPPPLNTFPRQHTSPPVKLEQLEAEQRHASEAQSHSAGHRPPPPPPPQPLPSLYAETGRLPPGQYPLSAYPISPRQSAGPGLPSPFESRGPSSYGDEGSYSPHRPADYKAAFDKHFQTNGYQDALQTIRSCCRTGYHFAEGYEAAAREQQGSPPIPSRMPTENEVSGLLNSLILALKKLEEVRDMVQQNRIQNERARENGGRGSDEDVSMYGDGIKPAYSMHEVKKRRGRAAPPGRCHSCNRVDTPEWRRGPDGARTLCNACGLHYAKLERKRQTDQRALRPKPGDERK